MTSLIAGNDLLSALRRALQHLYDPAELRRSPLFDLLGQPAPADRVAGLRGLLQTAIQAMKPDAKAAAASNAQRSYDILTYRFIEQSSQKEVAADLALSLRQLQRLETAALQSLAEALACQYHLELTWDELAPVNDAPVDAPQDQVAQELAWLKKSYQVEEINLRSLLEPIFSTLAALLKDTPVTFNLPDPLPPIQGQATSLQQALLNLLSLVAQENPGTLHLTARPHAGCIRLVIQSAPQPLVTLTDENMTLARQLFALSGAKLSIQPPPDFTIQVDFLPLGQALILVVDDNQDTLLLLERYLAGSGYQFLGIREPQAVLPLLEKQHPKVILLDVMLPGSDGWILLAQIKQHPAGPETHVIISTILPQEQLARTLGADAFLRKPFTREELLRTLAQF